MGFLIIFFLPCRATIPDAMLSLAVIDELIENISEQQGGEL